MLSTLAYTACLYAFTTLLGLPYSRWILRSSPGEGSSFLPSLLGLLILGISWTWGFGIGGGVLLVNALIAISLLVGTGVALKTLRTSQPLYQNPSLRGWRHWSGHVQIFLPLLATILLMSAPSWDGLNQHTLPARVGPDAVSYAVSAKIISEQFSYENYQSEIEERNGYQVRELLAVDRPRIYEVPSYTDQIGTEILLGALRWGVPGIVATVTQVTGHHTSYGVINAWALLCVFLSIGLGLEATAKRRKNIVSIVAGVTAFVASPVVLAAYFDGFFAQLVAVPFMVITYSAVKGVSRTSTKNRRTNQSQVSLLMIGVTGMTIFYPDALLFTVLVASFFIAITGARALYARTKPPFSGFSREELLIIRPAFWPGIAAILTCLPLAIHLPRWVHDRISQTGINGYWQPTWVSPIEIIGMPIFYGTREILRAVELGQVTPNENYIIVTWAISACVLYLTMRKNRRNHVLQQLLAAAALAVFFVYIQSDLRNLNNYQFFKAMSYAQPLFWMSLVTLLDEDETKSPRRVRLFSVGISAIGLSLLISNVVNFGQGTTITKFSQEIAVDAEQPVAQAILTKSLVIAPGHHVLMGSLASTSDILWLHRGYQGMETNFGGLENQPTYWIVFKEGRDDFQCVLEHIDSTDKDFIGSSFALFRISETSAVTTASLSGATTVLQTFFNQHSLGSVKSGWTTTECERDMSQD
jgi:hypothetical protein